MEVPRLVNKRLFCHACDQAFNDLINPDKMEEVKCIKCKSDFIEVLQKNEYCPAEPGPSLPEKSPNRHGRFARFFANPRIQTEISSRSSAPRPTIPVHSSVRPVHIEAVSHPQGFSYVEIGPHGSFRYTTYHSYSTPHVAPTGAPGSAPARPPEVPPTSSTSPVPPSSSSLPRPSPAPMPGPESSSRSPPRPAEEAAHPPGSSPMEEAKGANRHWFEGMMAQNLPQYMDRIFSDFDTMEWGQSSSQNPYSSDYLGGSVFGIGFPHLRLHDFFSETDHFFPTTLGVNLQDFGLNFASNFHRGNLINLAQLLSMYDYGNAGKPPTSKETLSKLPVFKLDKKHCKTDPSGKLETPNCAICCNNIELGENAQLLPCGHMFHPDCAKPWLTQHNTCPICRYELPTDDPAYEEIRKRNINQSREQREGH